LLQEATKALNSAFNNSFIKKISQYLHDCVREEVKSSTFRNLKGDKDNKWIFLKENETLLTEGLEYLKLDGANPNLTELMIQSENNARDKYLIYGYNASGQYGLLILFVLISVYCFVMMDEEKADADDIGIRNLLLLATALQLFAPLHVLASRINYYFIIFIPVALTRVNSKCKHMFWQVAKLAKYVMIVYFIFYFFFMKSDALQIMNYSFAF
jgi:hypothetical protein